MKKRGKTPCGGVNFFTRLKKTSERYLIKGSQNSLEGFFKISKRTSTVRKSHRPSLERETKLASSEKGTVVGRAKATEKEFFHEEITNRKGMSGHSHDFLIVGEESRPKSRHRVYNGFSLKHRGRRRREITQGEKKTPVQPGGTIKSLLSTIPRQLSDILRGRAYGNPRGPKEQSQGTQ